MIIYKYYKFPAESSVPKTWPAGVNVYQVGRIFNSLPVYNNVNTEISPGTYAEGWHVNVCYEGNIDMSFVQQYEITVNNPVCKWFGQP